MFIILLTIVVSTSNHAKCVLSNQKYMTQPTLFNLHLFEYSEELLYYHFVVNVDRCAGSCNTVDDVLITIMFS